VITALGPGCLIPAWEFIIMLIVGRWIAVLWVITCNMCKPHGLVTRVLIDVWDDQNVKAVVWSD
jgi:hypothetical protein